MKIEEITKNKTEERTLIHEVSTEIKSFNPVSMIQSRLIKRISLLVNLVLLMLDRVKCQML